MDIFGWYVKLSKEMMFQNFISSMEWAICNLLSIMQKHAFLFDFQGAFNFLQVYVKCLVLDEIGMFHKLSFC